MLNVGTGGLGPAMDPAVGQKSAARAVPVSSVQKAAERARLLRDLNLMDTASPVATRSGAADRSLKSEISLTPAVQAALDQASADSDSAHIRSSLAAYEATTQTGRVQTYEERVRAASRPVDLMPFAIAGVFGMGPVSKDTPSIQDALQAVATLLNPGVDFDPKNDKIDATYAAFHKAEAEALCTATPDASCAAVDWAHVGGPLPLRGAFARNPVDLGLKDKWTVPAKAATIGLGLAVGSKAELREHLAKSIDTVASRYAKEAGVNPTFLRQALDGTAVIESRYGVLRQVGGGAVPYESSAGGAFHMTNGHVQAMVDRYGARPEIAAQLAQIGIEPGRKLSKAAAWQIKENDQLAASFVALEMANQLGQNPELRSDVTGAATLGYMHHNMGHGGANAFLKGGLAALERVDHRVDDNNPLFFRGAKNANDVVDRYRSHMAGAIEAADMYRTGLSDAPKVAAKPDPKPRPTVLAMAAPGLNMR